MYTQFENLVSDPDQRQAMFESLYRELKIIARSRMAGERSELTFNATSLVHEAWMRLEKSAGEPWRDRSHFFAAASEAMRRILVEAARRRNATKRGSGVKPTPMDDIDLPDDTDHRRLLEVNEVLDALEAEDPMKAQIVKMRVYCGMENEEIAAVLNVNEKTVRRHWQVAKLRLLQMIQAE